MNKPVIAICCAIAALTAAAAGSTPDFDVMKDQWGLFQVDSKFIGENWSDTIVLDFTSDPDWYVGKSVDTATLELDFTNDVTDSHYKVWARWRGNYVWWWDHREFIRVKLEDNSVLGFGEVDNGQYQQEILFTDVLDDGVLSFKIRAWNRTGTGTAWLDHARLYGDFTDLAPNSVPEPLTLSAAALSAGALGGYIRRRRWRN